MASKIDEAGEGFSKAYIERLDNAIKNIGKAGTMAVGATKATVTGIVPSISGIFAKKILKQIKL